MTVSDDIFIAVIGDLVDSRNLSHRAEVQRNLVATLDRFNKKSEADIASRFLVTLGDEFQGLLRASAKASTFWWFFQGLMHTEAPTRIGFGVGRLTTDLREEALGMDGPCFYAARAAIERAKEQRLRLAFGVAGQPFMTEILDRVSRPLERISRGWSEVQWQTLLGLIEGLSQTEIAKKRGVARQSVNDMIRASLAVECQEAWKGIDQLVQFFIHELDSGRSESEWPT